MKNAYQMDIYRKLKQIKLFLKTKYPLCNHKDIQVKFLEAIKPWFQLKNKSFRLRLTNEKDQNQQFLESHLALKYYRYLNYDELVFFYEFQVTHK